MDRRRFVLSALGGALAALAATPAEAAPDPLLQDVQYGYGPPPGRGRRRRRRCWVERVRVPRRDRYGRVFYVIREREVCR